MNIMIIFRLLLPTTDLDGSLPWKRSVDGSNLVDIGILDK